MTIRIGTGGFKPTTDAGRRQALRGRRACP
jgi:hypothetical protein